MIDVAIPAGHPKVQLSCEQPLPGQHVISVGHPIHSQWVLVGGYLPNSGLIAGRYVSLGFPVGLRHIGRAGIRRRGAGGRDHARHSGGAQLDRSRL